MEDPNHGLQNQLLITDTVNYSKVLKNQTNFETKLFTVEVEDNRVAKVTHTGSNDRKDEHVYDVTCLSEGSTEATLIIGNSRTETNA